MSERSTVAERAHVAGLVLAAGASVRMGGVAKLFLPYGDSTVLEASVDGASAAGLRPIVIVAGSAGAVIRSTLAGRAVRVLDSPPPPAGQSASLVAGIAAVGARDDVGAAVVLLGDEPGVTSRAILQVVGAWRASGGDAVRAVYRDRPGHPVLLARSVFGLVAGLEDDRGARDLLARPDLDLREIRFATDAPIDIDTPDDYRKATGRDLPDAG